MKFHRFTRSLFLSFALLAPAATFSRTAHAEFKGPDVAGKMEAPPGAETSGLAPSRRVPDVLWTHDDSGGEPVLYAVGTDGRRRGELHVRGVKNRDWEDLASFELDGKAWLLIGDMGDNDAARSHVELHLVEEPPAEQLARGGDFTAKPAWTLRLVYEDGPRDCESLAVDPAERAIYLQSKRDKTPRLYRVALPTLPPNGNVLARFVGSATRIPQPSAARRLLTGSRHRYWAQPCAMDFAADGSAALVVTYGDALLFRRDKDESWAAAFARDPVVLGDHALPQAEAGCFSRDGNAIYVASEQEPQLLRYERK